MARRAPQVIVPGQAVGDDGQPQNPLPPPTSIGAIVDAAGSGPVPEDDPTGPPADAGAPIPPANVGPSPFPPPRRPPEFNFFKKIFGG